VATRDEVRQAVERQAGDERADNGTLRGHARRLLRRFLEVAERRMDRPRGKGAKRDIWLGSLDPGEYRLLRVILNTYKASVEEVAAEKPEVVIQLGGIPPEVLRERLRIVKERSA